jgi:hypothetical protein
MHVGQPAKECSHSSHTSMGLNKLHVDQHLQHFRRPGTPVRSSSEKSSGGLATGSENCPRTKGIPGAGCTSTFS